MAIDLMQLLIGDSRNVDCFDGIELLEFFAFLLVNALLKFHLFLYQFDEHMLIT